MEQYSFTVIRTAREGVNVLDQARCEKGLSQMAISELADVPDVGQQYYRMYRSGDVRISKFLRFLKVLGYKLVIMKEE